MNPTLNGHFQSSQNGYKYYLPSLINRDHIFSPEVYNLCIKASQKLAELNAFSNFAPDISFFIQMHIGKEALHSNKIEGTKTEMEDLYIDNALIPDEKRNELEEVKNYIKSLNYGITRMEELPLSTRLLQECHKILLEGVRGKNKNPGKFRHSQNWIGGATIMDAHFVPPSQEHIPELMSDLEKFLHYNSCPELIKIGIAHYQFETIHPFLDGNGRVGRLLITLYLIHSRLLYKPVLYLSEFFEKNQSLYYQNLDIGRTNAGLDKWLKFFLVGVAQTAEKNLIKLEKIVKLKLEIEKKIMELGRRAKNAQLILDYLFTNPVISVAKAQKIANLSSHSAANNLINDFARLGILDEKTKFKRNRVFVFREYLEIFQKS